MPRSKPMTHAPCVSDGVSTMPQLSGTKHAAIYNNPPLCRATTDVCQGRH